MDLLLLYLHLIFAQVLLCPHTYSGLSLFQIWCCFCLHGSNLAMIIFGCKVTACSDHFLWVSPCCENVRQCWWWNRPRQNNIRVWICSIFLVSALKSASVALWICLIEALLALVFRFSVVSNFCDHDLILFRDFHPFLVSFSHFSCSFAMFQS